MSSSTFSSHNDDVGRCAFPSLFALPGERAGHVDGSPTRQCQVLLLRSIVLSVAVREGCCAVRLRVTAERANRTNNRHQFTIFFVLTVLISPFSTRDTFVVRIFLAQSCCSTENMKYYKLKNCSIVNKKI